MAYHRELRAGDRFAVADRILDRSAKAVRIRTFLIDTGRGRIADIAEFPLTGNGRPDGPVNGKTELGGNPADLASPV